MAALICKTCILGGGRNKNQQTSKTKQNLQHPPPPNKQNNNDKPKPNKKEGYQNSHQLPCCNTYHQSLYPRNFWYLDTTFQKRLVTSVWDSILDCHILSRKPKRRTVLVPPQGIKLCCHHSSVTSTNCRQGWDCCSGSQRHLNYGSLFSRTGFICLSDCTSEDFSKFTSERAELPQHAALLGYRKNWGFFSIESTVQIWHHRVLLGRDGWAWAAPGRGC